MSIRNLDQLFDPASVAVFGASQRAASVGATVWTQLRAGAFKGPLYAVNPKYRELGGQPVYARAADLPTVPELAVLCTPPAVVADLIAGGGPVITGRAVGGSPGPVHFSCRNETLMTTNPMTWLIVATRRSHIFGRSR